MTKSATLVARYANGKIKTLPFCKLTFSRYLENYENDDKH